MASPKEAASPLESTSNWNSRVSPPSMLLTTVSCITHVSSLPLPAAEAAAAVCLVLPLLPAAAVCLVPLLSAPAASLLLPLPAAAVCLAPPLSAAAASLLPLLPVAAVSLVLLPLPLLAAPAGSSSAMASSNDAASPLESTSNWNSNASPPSMLLTTVLSMTHVSSLPLLVPAPSLLLLPPTGVLLRVSAAAPALTAGGASTARSSLARALALGAALAAARQVPALALACHRVGVSRLTAASLAAAMGSDATAARTGTAAAGLAGARVSAGALLLLPPPPCLRLDSSDKLPPPATLAPAGRLAAGSAWLAAAAVVRPPAPPPLLPLLPAVLPAGRCWLLLLAPLATAAGAALPWLRLLLLAHGSVGTEVAAARAGPGAAAPRTATARAAGLAAGLAVLLAVSSPAALPAAAPIAPMRASLLPALLAVLPPPVLALLLLPLPAAVAGEDAWLASCARCCSSSAARRRCSSRSCSMALTETCNPDPAKPEP